MPNSKITSVQDAPDIACLGDKSKRVQATDIAVPLGRDTGNTTLEVTTGSRREDADRQAIERGEDDGMSVHQSATSSAHNGRDLNAITER